MGGAEMTGPRPLRADARRNRERLLEVARTAFAEEGLAVPLDEIAGRAGVGPGTLYRHFPTKEALFEAVLQDRMQRLADEAGALRDAPDPGAALLGFIDRLVAEAAPKKDLVDALASAGTGISAALAETGARIRGEIGHLLARAQRDGAVRSDIGTADLMALIAGVLFALQRRSAELADPRRAVAVLRDGLRAAPGPGGVAAEPAALAVTRVTEEDWRAWREVRLAALADAPESFAGTLDETEALPEREWRAMTRTGAIFIAAEGSSPVGVAAGVPRGSAAERGLGAMWVAPRWRGRGAAPLLAAAVIAWARAEGAARLGLWVPADNARARAFYERQGFLATGRTRPFPGSSGRFIAEMILELSGSAGA
jgi:AcrR family transcriptional regulator/GNAT superfamily N-acetyltransferase